MATKYTRKERALIATTFKAAKEWLWDGEEYQRPNQKAAICYAVSAAAETSMTRLFGYSLALDVVMARLQPEVMVTNYLRKQVKVPEEQMTWKNIQAFRHRWLDSLIEEFSQ